MSPCVVQTNLPRWADSNLIDIFLDLSAAFHAVNSNSLS